MKTKAEPIVKWKMPDVPNRNSLEKRTAPLLAQSKNFEIKSEDHFLASWALVQRHDVALDAIEKTFDPFISGLHRLHKMAISMRDLFLKPVLDSKNTLLAKRKMYRGLQEQKKKEQEEAAAKALQAQQQKELERQAKAAERAGDKQVAEVIREQKAQVPMPFFRSAPAVPKQEGSVIKKRWLFEIVDPVAVEREYCSPDPKLIRPIVESLGPACKISGLRIWEDEKEFSRSASNG
jgi:hypothetical protein